MSDYPLTSTWAEVDAAAQAVKNGLPKANLSGAVQASLDKADGAWARLYWVTISRSGGSYTCDKSLAEIQTAYAAGKCIRANLPDGFQSDFTNNDGGAMFYAFDDSGGSMMLMRYTVGASDVTFQAWPVGGQGITDEIKTPHVLTSADFNQSVYKVKTDFDFVLDPSDTNASKVISAWLHIKPGEQIVYKANSIAVGMWVRPIGDSTFTNLVEYAANTAWATLDFDTESDLIIQLRHRPVDQTLTPSGYNADIIHYTLTDEKQNNAIERIDGRFFEVETLQKSDFVRYALTLLTDVRDTNTKRVSIKYPRKAHAGDIIRFRTRTLILGIWVVYAGDTEATNIFPYYTSPAYKDIVLERDCIEILFQFRNAANTAINVSDVDADMHIIRQTGKRYRFGEKLFANVKSINHRGYQDYAPENTIPAFELSAKNGFGWIETDVQFTSDGVPVILHDRSINRTARNSDGTSISSTVNIDSITYEQALTYDFGVWFSSAYAGTKIPSFEQMIAKCRKLGLKVRIELKTETVTTSNFSTLVTIVNKYGMIKNVEWASSGLSLLQHIAQNYDTFDLCYIDGSLTSTDVSNAVALKTGKNNVCIATSVSATDTQVGYAVSAGIPLDLYTVTCPNHILETSQYVSSYTTNRYMAEEILPWY